MRILFYWESKEIHKLCTEFICVVDICFNLGIFIFLVYAIPADLTVERSGEKSFSVIQFFKEEYYKTCLLTTYKPSKAEQSNKNNKCPSTDAVL